MKRWILALLLWPLLANAEEIRMDLPLTDGAGWTFLSDQVMGGVSEGRAQLGEESGQPVLQLTGDVSTANRGGFVQVRLKLPSPLPPDARGVILTARGNDQRYFIHLRTRGTALPWQYYQAGFDVTPDWQEVRLPFDTFKPSGGLLRATPRPGSIQNIGLVAYGRDHAADVSLKAIGFY